MSDRIRRRRRTAFVWGLGTILLVAIGCWFAVNKRLPWSDDWEIRAVLRSASEVHSRTPVRVAGIEAGKVKHVERGPGDTAIVTFAVSDEARPIHEDATLKLRPRIFLEGNFFLDLRPGTPSSPEMEEGGVIPLSQTAIPVQLDQILSVLDEDTRSNLRGLVHGLSESLDEGGSEAFAATVKELDPAFTGGAITAESFRGEAPGDLPGFLRGSGRTASALARGERLADLVRGLDRTLGALAAERDSLGRSVERLDLTVRAAYPALARVDRLFAPARAFVADIRPGLREAPGTLRLANPLLAQLQAAVRPRELPGLVTDLDPAVRDLRRLEPPLEETLGLVTPVTECLRRNAVPTLMKGVEDPPHTTGEPVYRELLYGLVGLASATQNFDGNGPAVRYHAGFGDQTVSLGQAGAAEQLVGRTSDPILGSRPRRPAKRPPFRPDVPCVSQRPPDLRAETGPAPRQSTVPAEEGRLREMEDLERVLRAGEREAKRAAREREARR